MGEFNDCGLWMKLTFLTSTIGFLLDLFGMSMGMGGFAATSNLATAYKGGNGHDVAGLLVTGFLLFLAAAALLLVIVHIDEMKSSKIAAICFIVMAILAGLLTIIGIADWHGAYIGDGAPYPTMVGVLGSLLIILAAIFAILDLVGVKAGGGGGGGGGGAKSADSDPSA